MKVKNNLRYAVLTGSLALVACTSVASDDHAETIDSNREALSKFTPIRGVKASKTFVARSVDKTPISVVAKLDGLPVALHQELLGRKLTTVEKDGVVADNRAKQDALEPRIQALGGRVTRKFQNALNGVKIEIPRNKLGELRNLPGVIDVKPVTRYTRNNTVSVPAIHAPEVWSGVFGLRGEGVKLAVIDTGIDYTHANFGGPGTTAAYDAARAASADPAPAALFGTHAPKVKGGIDLAGDAYDAQDPASVPVPDGNPIDCGEGHGSHVSGTATGLGVLADGTTFEGPYDSSAYLTHHFRIGPGVAPKADLYSIRVFGCEGSTNLVVDALDWAVDHDMDVVNMSLGSSFGSSDDADSEAADNAVKGGVIVVASQGNDGDISYISGGPAASSRTIAVAAADKGTSNPGATITLPGGSTLTALDANGAAFANGTTYPVKVLHAPDGSISLGCDPADYVGVAGTLAVVQRGTCGRVARAIYGRDAGAAAVIMINSDGTLPPFEGDITQNPDTGVFVTPVAIPFFGIGGPAADPGSDGSALAAADGQTVSFANLALPAGLAGFTSTGPRRGDSALKPDITGPGVAIVSTANGTGNNGVAFSGTSMASPHVAGVAALTLQAHPKWKPAAVKAAIMNSGDPSNISDFATRRAGTGMVNAASAARTQVYAEADDQLVTLNFGFEEIDTNFDKTKNIQLHNTGNAPAKFKVGHKLPQGSAHTISFDQATVTVPAHSTANVKATLHVPVKTVGDASAFRDVAGLVTFTPVASANYGVALSLAYYFVPRALSDIRTTVAGKLKGTPLQTSVVLDNFGGKVPGSADFYAWGLEKPKSNLGAIDLRAAGIQTFGDVAAIALNTYEGWSTSAPYEYDVPVDTNGDGTPDFIVIGIDLGIITDGAFNGTMVSAVADATGSILSVNYLAGTSTDTSTIVLPFLTADLGLTPANPRIAYSASTFDLFSGASDTFTTAAKFNVFSPAISTGAFEVLAPNKNKLVTLTGNAAELALTPPLGIMVISPDNKNGKKEASLEKIKW